jgi:Tfp pilus assembly protein PilF
MLSGDDLRAGALFERALEDYRSVGDTYGIASCLENLAVIGLRGGKIDLAAANLRESLQLSSSIGDAHSLTASLPAAAAVALARGDPDAAARLGGAVSKTCRTLGLALEPIEARLMTDTTAALQEALGDSFNDAWATGANMDLATTVDLAVKRLGG